MKNIVSATQLWLRKWTIDLSDPFAAAHTGADSWNVVSNLGRAAAAFAASPSVTMVILAMQGVAFVALVALQRLLRSDTESL